MVHTIQTLKQGKKIVPLPDIWVVEHPLDPINGIQSCIWKHTFLSPLLPTCVPIIWQPNLLVLNYAETTMSNPVYHCHILQIGRLKYSVQIKEACDFTRPLTALQSHLGFEGS